jgi:hypothetical protein
MVLTAAHKAYPQLLRSLLAPHDPSERHALLAALSTGMSSPPPAAADALRAGLLAGLGAMAGLVEWLAALLGELERVLGDFFASADRHEAASPSKATPSATPLAEDEATPRAPSPQRGSRRSAPRKRGQGFKAALDRVRPGVEAALDAGADASPTQQRNERRTMIFRKFARLAQGRRGGTAGVKGGGAPVPPAQLAQLRSWLAERNEMARAQIDAWRRSRPAPAPTGFLEEDVPGSFLASMYELKVRLAHTLERSKLLLGALRQARENDTLLAATAEQDATEPASPSRLPPRPTRRPLEHEAACNMHVQPPPPPQTESLGSSAAYPPSSPLRQRHVELAREN